MSESPADRLTKLLASTTIKDDEEVYELATAAIRINKADHIAHRTRIVALLKLDRWQDAVRVVDEADTKVQETCRLEKAYALYKIGELDSAYQLLEPIISATKQGRSVRHLAAQIAYKDEKFSVAADIYKTMIEQAPIQEESENYDLLINSLAVLAQLEWTKNNYVSDLLVPQGIPDAFESTYNKACCALAAGDLSNASELLSSAASMCLSSDLTDDEKRTEMANISIQQVYICARLGMLDEAAHLAASIDTANGELSTIFFHRLNSLVVQHYRGIPNPYIVDRFMSSLPDMPPGEKIFDFQSSRFEYDRQIAHLFSQKPNCVSNAISRKMENEPLPTTSVLLNSLSIVRAAAECNMEIGKNGLQKLLALYKSRRYDIGLLLIIVQLYADMGKPDGALRLLDSFGRLIDQGEGGVSQFYRYLPGLVALKVALLSQQGRQSAIRNELSTAAAYWTENPEQGGSNSLLRYAGVKLLYSSDPNSLAIAGAAFEKLARDSSVDKIARAGFVASTATTDYTRVEPYVAGLESVDRLAEFVDIDTALENGVVSFPAQLEKQRKKRNAEEIPFPLIKKKRRLRKTIKGYVEGKQMDPERWLPLRDRSSYRPRGKKGKKRAIEATTQGGIIKEEQGEILELVGGAGAVKVEKAGGNGKKKKKNKK